VSRARENRAAVGLRRLTTPAGFLMKSRKELHEELRQFILSLPGVTERQNCGIHEDAFFVGRTMFMHIHGFGHCDIRLPLDQQQRVLAEGRARPHRWAPEKGFITAPVTDRESLVLATGLIQISHQHFFAAKPTPGLIPEADIAAPPDC
jgi:hypothetical protein